MLCRVNISSLNLSLFLPNRVPTRVSFAVTSETLRSVYNKEYLQPLLAICNQSCTILSICGIVLSASSFLWESEGAIFFGFTGDVLLVFFAGSWLEFFARRIFFWNQFGCFVGSLFGSSEQKNHPWRCNFCALVFHAPEFAHGSFKFWTGKMETKRMDRCCIHTFKTKQKRTIQIFTYELFIQNNNLNIKKININKLNKTSARIIDNFFFFFFVRANTTWGKMCEHHFFCAILASNVRMFAHFVRIWEPLRKDTI